MRSISSDQRPACRPRIGTPCGFTHFQHRCDMASWCGSPESRSKIATPQFWHLPTGSSSPAARRRADSFLNSSPKPSFDAHNCASRSRPSSSSRLMRSTACRASSPVACSRNSPLPHASPDGRAASRRSPFSRPAHCSISSQSSGLIGRSSSPGSQPGHTFLSSAATRPIPAYMRATRRASRSGDGSGPQL